jgi:hypothetical protein
MDCQLQMEINDLPTLWNDDIVQLLICCFSEKLFPENENYLIALNRNIIAPTQLCCLVLLEDVGLGK